MRRPVTRLLAALALVVLALAGGVALYAFWPAGPDFDPAPLLERAEAYDVRILRDDFGVPHVYGPRDADVAYGLAYAHAEDDAATIQRVLLATRGRLASVEGPDAAPIDYLAHLLGVWDDVEAGYAARLSPATRALAEGYADGFNHWAALHPDEVLPGVVPVRGQDVVAGFAFRTPFFYGLENHLRALFEGDAPREEPDRSPQTGSNAVAVAPWRSTDGHTRLLVNSHQPYEGPVAWYEVRLVSGEGWDMAGGVFPGSPVVLHGHNRHLGWASTVNTPDLFDVYALATDPEQPGRYRLGDEWRALERRTVTLPVRLFGRLRWPVEREVLRSEHGPALALDAGTFAFRYAGIGEMRQLEQYYRMNRAESFDAWWDAMAMQALPSVNFVYADARGNIAYLYNATLPRREPGFDWSGTLPGDRPELIWREVLPLDELPFVVNPPSGYVLNCNHTPFRATAEGQGPRREDFPERLGIETRMTNRAWRALELYGGDPRISRDEFHAYKYDKRYSERSAVREVMADVLALEVDPEREPRLAEAQELLRAWSYDTEIENRATALAVWTALPVILARRQDLPPPEPRAALEDAVATLLEHHGQLDPPWGTVNRFRRGATEAPIGGGPDVLRAAEDFEPEPDGTFLANSGDTLVYFVEWDPDGAVRSESIHQYGSATSDPASPHFADQVPLFLAEETKPVWLDLADLREHLEREYRPGEELRER